MGAFPLGQNMAHPAYPIPVEPLVAPAQNSGAAPLLGGGKSDPVVQTNQI